MSNRGLAWSRLCCGVARSRCRVAATVVALVIGVGPAPGQSVGLVTSTKVPYTATVFVPCAADGEGEWVDLTGFQRVVRRSVPDSRGGLHVTVAFHAMGVSGVGQTTGDRYQATGGSEHVFNASDAGAAEFTTINTFFVIGRGRGADFLTHQLIHVTFGPDSLQVVNLDRVWVECR